MSSSTPTLSSWLDTIQNSIGQVLPGVNIAVLAGTVAGAQEVDTDDQPGSPLASIFSDPYAENPITQAFNEETGAWEGLNTAAGDGSFQFWAAPGYYVIQVWGPGINGQLIYGIALNTSNLGQVFFDNETPGGAINGVNSSFTLANSPMPAGSLILVQSNAASGGAGGATVLIQGVDYTLTGNELLLTNPPSVGDNLRAWYRT